MGENMKKQIVSIFVGMLLFVTVSSVTGTINNENTSTIEPTIAPTGIVWSDNFDNYTLGQFLDGGAEDGGWEGWDNTPSVGAKVTGNQSLSSPHSVDISLRVDLVHRYSGLSSGNCTYRAMQYIPSDYNGDSSFILLNTYDPPTHHWSTQLRFLSADGVVHSDFDENELPIIYDQWVEIRVEIDFTTDEQTIYYGGDELVTKSWSEGVSGPGGQVNLAAVDLYSGDSLSTNVYYDDMSIYHEASADPDLYCEGSLVWENVSKGSEQTGSFDIENVGGGLLDWDIVKKPSWGEWTFVPNGGDDLAPGDPLTVQVTVVAPDEKNQNFAGQIKIQNGDDPEDSCTIDVKLSTPMNKPYIFQHILEKLIQRFPALELILSHILG
jgi:hypothetical protein